jgi:hypothetical protein
MVPSAVRLGTLRVGHWTGSYARCLLQPVLLDGLSPPGSPDLAGLHPVLWLHDHRDCAPAPMIPVPTPFSLLPSSLLRLQPALRRVPCAECGVRAVPGVLPVAVGATCLLFAALLVRSAAAPRLRLAHVSGPPVAGSLASGVPGQPVAGGWVFWGHNSRGPRRLFRQRSEYYNWRHRWSGTGTINESWHYPWHCCRFAIFSYSE